MKKKQINPKHQELLELDGNKDAKIKEKRLQDLDGNPAVALWNEEYTGDRKDVYFTIPDNEHLFCLRKNINIEQWLNTQMIARTGLPYIRVPMSIVEDVTLKYAHGMKCAESTTISTANTSKAPKLGTEWKGKNEIDLITDCPITELTALDFIAIMYKKPIASKDFINKIILDLKKTK